MSFCDLLCLLFENHKLDLSTAVRGGIAVDTGAFLSVPSVGSNYYVVRNMLRCGIRCTAVDISTSQGVTVYIGTAWLPPVSSG
jgi:hypothetical protein